MDGASAGTLRATVRMNGDAVAFNFGYDPDSSPTNPGPLREVLNALKNHDLFAVYYDSGHVVSPNGIWHRNVNSSPFPNWRFHDFSGVDIATEKPGKKPVEIHERAGLASDRSLFGWSSGTTPPDGSSATTVPERSRTSCTSAPTGC